MKSNCICTVCGEQAFTLTGRSIECASIQCRNFDIRFADAQNMQDVEDQKEFKIEYKTMKNPCVEIPLPCSISKAKDDHYRKTGVATSGCSSVRLVHGSGILSGFSQTFKDTHDQIQRGLGIPKDLLDTSYDKYIKLVTGSDAIRQSAMINFSEPEGDNSKFCYVKGAVVKSVPIEEALGLNEPEVGDYVAYRSDPKMLIGVVYSFEIVDEILCGVICMRADEIAYNTSMVAIALKELVVVDNPEEI
ncbi:hypothetical protein KAR91_50245 [Candidatus Pacearchaeota archaeon]|nr:hypothetical protein [Candidatus Pacearchaeota archaeon]